MKNQNQKQNKNEAANESSHSSLDKEKISKYSRDYYLKNKPKILAKMDEPKDVVARLTQILVEKERIPLTRIRLHFKEAGLK